MQVAEQQTRPYVIAPCAVCGLECPCPRDFVAHLCHGCLVMDLAQVLQECPERFQQLPTIRALRNLPRVVVWGRSGEKEAAAEKKLKLGLDTDVAGR